MRKLEFFLILISIFNSFLSNKQEGNKNNKNEYRFKCDTKKGFNFIPKQYGNKLKCICKDGYSFYENTEICIKNDILEKEPFCISEFDKNSLTPIYIKITPGMSTYNKKGKLYCDIKKDSNDQDITSQSHEWFSLGTKTYFYWMKIKKCVYILYDKEIVMYSNKDDCLYDKNYIDDYNDFFGINNEEKYNSILNKAYEYNPYSDNNNKKNSLIIEKDEITFYLLNNYTENILSSIQLSEKCLTSIFNTYKINSLLIFIASSKKENSIKDKIKYELYNPTPEKINQKNNSNIFRNSP